MIDNDTMLYIAAAAAIGSELIALFPRLKSNSWVQLVMNVLKSIRGSGIRVTKRY